MTWIKLEGWLGPAICRQALLGFAPAKLLHTLSFADVLNEDTGTGYQRRLNPQHSLDFRRYAISADATTIPLTFNIRPTSKPCWRLIGDNGPARLEIDPQVGKVLAQVDCQHRLGHMHDVDTPLPFMCFIGLAAAEEMEVFRVINSKAKGLSTSLIDYHDAQLAKDLEHERLELFVALQLNVHPESPWRRQLDLGGEKTSGLARRASLRTMQKALRDYLLSTTDIAKREKPEAITALVLNFWSALTEVLPEAWSEPRRYMLTKGVGVYALTGILADVYKDKGSITACTKGALRAELSSFADKVDWSGTGTFKGLGGEAGAKEALRRLRAIRAEALLPVKVLSYGR